MPDNFDIWKLIARADNHLCHAHFGRYSSKAKAGLYGRAAALLVEAAHLLLDAANEATEADLREAEAMLRRAYGQRS